MVARSISDAPGPLPIRPPALGTGARVALISPAGPSGPDRIERAITHCRELGLDPLPLAHVLDRNAYLAGSDADRLADFEAAIADPDIRAIWAMRGGYGTMRLLDRLDLRPLRDRPKAFIGFSDNTAVHLALQRLGVVSFHAAHSGADYGAFTTGRLRDVLFRAVPAGVLPLDGAGATCLVSGRVEGRLAGGNLSLLAAACGTPFALDARDRIVVIEDVNEPAYRIDRAFTQLRLAGCLDGVLGFAFGRFEAEAQPTDDPPIESLLADLVSPFGVPAVTGLPFGHIDEQWCLPFGVMAGLDTSAPSLALLEPAVVETA